MFQKHDRKSVRYKRHAYDDGVYFVTINTRNREHFFGTISAGQMNLSLLGQYATDIILDIGMHHPYCEIPISVVMPNHIHAIILIDGLKIPYDRDRRDVACRVPTEKMRYVADQQGWLSVVIGNFKSAITKFANENNVDFAWQTRFHDRVIRNEREFEKYKDYIMNNVEKWAS